jgi:hypothetical protein
MRKDSPAPIEVEAAKQVAEKFGYDQIIIIGRRIGGDGKEWVTTYGRDPANSEAAILIGEYLKYKIMKWPRRGGN